MDRVEWMRYPGGNGGQAGETVYTTYNPQGLANSVYGSSSYVQSAGYDALGQPTEMTLGNGAQTRYGYWGLGGDWDSRPGDGFSSLGRLFRLRTRDSAGRPLLDLRYGYDAGGNVTSVKEAPREAANWPTSGFIFQDAFNSKDTTNWTWSSYQTVPYNDGGNNVVKSSGTDANWNAHFYRNAYSLTSGKGLQVRFKVDRTDTAAHLCVEANDATYRRFGVIADGGRLRVQYNDGGGWRYPADLLTNLALNTWYVVRLVVEDGGRGFYVEAYQENSPTVRGAFSQWMPTGKSWRFHHWIWRGNAYIDDYREFNTGGLTWSPDERMTFTYDALDRLTNSAPESGGQGYSEAYAYNNVGNMTSKGGVSYGYNDPAHKHAVTHLGGVQKYWYDANGNMTQRIVGSDTYDQAWVSHRYQAHVFQNHLTQRLRSTKAL